MVAHAVVQRQDVGDRAGLIDLGFGLDVGVNVGGEVFDALMEVGEPLGLKPTGYRAIESLRLEKGYRAWGADITPNDSPFEAGLGWAVKLGRNIDFMGRAAAEKTAAAPLGKRMVAVTVDDPGTVLLGRETILRDGAFAGYLSSGGFGYTIGKPIGYGYLRHAPGVTDDWIAAGRYELVVASERVPASIHLGPLHDPEGTRIKS